MVGLMLLHEHYIHTQALKEAYLPESGIWMSTYPYIAKDRFLEISLDIERERQAQQQRQAQ